MSCYCCGEENQTDGPVKPLREVIQQLETSGMVDFVLGGHEFSRDAAVMQGRSPDKSTPQIVFCFAPMVIVPIFV